MAKPERHKLIRERNLEQQIRELVAKGVPVAVVAEQLSLPPSAVTRFVREDTLKNYDDSRLNAISKVDTYNPLSLVDTFFDSAAFVAAELRFTSVLAAKFREHISELVTEQGMRTFSMEENQAILESWYTNTEKLSKLSEKTQKQLETYINLLTQILDVSREISYVRVVTEILQESDPATYKKIQRALQEDTAAKAVMNSLDTTSIVDFWVDNGTPAKARKELENEGEE